MNSSLLHASCVAVHGKGVLLLGESGAGKSDLALRLIDTGATLVADDQVRITRENDTLLASAPDALQGLLEVRGLGIYTMPFTSSALAFAVQLVSGNQTERLPTPATFDCLGVTIPLHLLAAFDASTTAKIRLLRKTLTPEEHIAQVKP